MKLKYLTTVLTIVLPLSLYTYASYYGPQSLSYTTTEFITYVLIWGIALFFVNLIALLLQIEKYKKWLLFSLGIFLVSVVIACLNMRGSNTILSFNGEIISWILAVLYSFSSIVYFIVQFIKNRR